MKKGLVFLLGMVCGFIMAYYRDIRIGAKESPVENEAPKIETMEGLSLLSEPGETLPFRSFRVNDVFPDGSALASSKKNDFYMGPTVYFLPEDGVVHYDGQIINIPAGKVARVMGTFQHYGSTHPIVKFFDK